MSKPDAVHTVAEVPGAVRRSPRTYTHAVVCDYDHAIDVAQETRLVTEQCQRDWAYMVECAAGTHAQSHFPSYSVPRGSTLKEVYSEVLAKCGHSLAAYIVERVRQRVASCRPSQPVVLQWSMSERAARAAVGTWAKRSGAYTNVRVVPVVRVTKGAA